MKRLGFCVAVLWGLASIITAQSPTSTRQAAPSAVKPAASSPQTPGPSSRTVAPAASHAATPASSAAVPAPGTFEKYCFECHGTYKPEADLSIEQLLKKSGLSAAGEYSQDWERVAHMLETKEMPPVDASAFPTDSERAAATTWIRSSLKAYETAHAGEPGRVTVRRLTSAEYGYAIRDLTGIDIKVGVDASSDSVGGEGFANFGDVQFVQDTSIERYLEAAKVVSEHAVIGAGPLDFYADPGKTGLELSALNRINELYASKGFRVVSGEGGRPFGLDRYGKALYVAWYFKNRVALGDPAATLRGLAAKEGITGRFADHIWSVVNTPNTKYPTRETVDAWTKLPAPTSDIKASLAKAQAGCDTIYKSLTTWPSWFFARGDVAAGGAGDESPLMFDDASLKAVPTRHYTYAVGGAGRGGVRGRGPTTTPPAPSPVFLTLANLNPVPGIKPVVIWRNAHVITRAAPAAGGGRGGGPAGGAGAAGATVAGAGAAVVAPTAPAPVAQAPAPVVPAAATPTSPAVAGAAPARAGGAAGNGAVTQAPPQPGALVGRGAIVPPLSDRPLREVLAPDVAAKFNFGVSPDGTTLGPNDFATTETVSFMLDPAAGGATQELQVDAELGADKANTVVRLMLTATAEGSARDVAQKVLLGDPKGAGYKAFRAGMVQYVSLLPPNSHGEANPADKDPVPAPFDNTYNSPEHDAFVLKVKYQRSDTFFRENLVDGADRAKLDQAWNDLFSSWPYHDAYLGMLIDHFKLTTLKSRKVEDLTPLVVAAQPAEVRPYLTEIRAHYDMVMKTELLAEPAQVTDAIAFASRAWRRPLTVVEKTNLRTFYQRARTVNHLDHDGAVRAMVARILMSPAFLYRVETVARTAETPLTGWEMASRMSFFLWSSIPDEELRRAAAAGELSDPVKIATQVKRMTADPKARRLATEFFGQWLGFYHFDEYRGIDTSRFPEFTEDVKSAMYDESVSTFEYIVRQNRPIQDVLYADYTFLNKPLAAFYGIKSDAVKSTGKVELVKDAAAFNRGGALRLGSVLSITSAPLRTSPVKRGDWVLRRILGTPTPPPPADAGSIPADDKTFAGMTLRQRLTQHKRNATCANCHLKIDPLGFPLEGFDAVGRVRDKYTDGQAVDVTGEFADKTTIVGTDGLLKYLQSQNTQVMTTMSKKMLGYALGRTVGAPDRTLVSQMVAAGGSASFADLATRIVTSRQFRNHAGDEAEIAAPKTSAPKTSISAATPAVTKTASIQRAGIR